MVNQSDYGKKNKRILSGRCPFCESPLIELKERGNHPFSGDWRCSNPDCVHVFPPEWFFLSKSRLKFVVLERGIKR